MNEYRIHLIESDPRVATSLAEPCRAAGLTVAATHPSIEALLDSAATPDVIVLDSATVGGTPAAGVRPLLQRWPAACVIVTGGTPTTVSHAVAAGARGFLLKPYAAADLCAVIRESMESAHLAGRSRAKGRIAAVYSPKGGAGCSTIAVNLAVLSAARPRTSVAVIDLDLQFGDIAVMLDLRSPNSIVDLIGHGDLDAALVNDTFVRHASGVRVLPAPRDLASVASIAPARVERTLAALRDHFDLVVCDLWTSLDDLTTRVLRAADVVVLVTKPEVPALKSMSRVLSARELDLDLDESAIVVANRLPTRGGPSATEIERSLAHPIAVAIPSDGLAVVDAINRGIPVVDPRIRSRVQHAFRELTDAVWQAFDATARPVEHEPVLVPA